MKTLSPNCAIAVSISSHGIIGGAYLANYQNIGQYEDKLFTALFCPVDEVMDVVQRNCDSFSGNTIGVHIRRTDHIISIKESPTELFVNAVKSEIDEHDDTKIYLATDDQPTKHEFLSLFGDRVVTMEAAAARGNVEGIRGGLVDMWTLSRTAKIFGSANSTTITAETLLQFGITDDTSSGTGIMAINQNTSRHSYENEREMLFQVLTTLNKEVKELKEMMNKQAERKTEAMSDTAVINYGQQPQIIQQAPTQRIVNIEPGLCNIPTIETIEETKQLTMREVEEQQIREALLRNHGNRGRTATELGISERTLYRKIKEYNITVTK